MDELKKSSKTTPSDILISALTDDEKIMLFEKLSDAETLISDLKNELKNKNSECDKLKTELKSEHEIRLNHAKRIRYLEKILKHKNDFEIENKSLKLKNQEQSQEIFLLKSRLKK